MVYNYRLFFSRIFLDYTFNAPLNNFVLIAWERPTYLRVYAFKPNTASSDVIVVLLTVLTPFGRDTYQYLIPTNS